MNRKAFNKAALSSLLVATTMVNCTGAAFRTHSAAVQPKGDAAKLAASATGALDHKDAAKAVAAAEAAVTLEPRNAAYRQILGRAYIQAGRFASADATLSDAMALGNTDASTIVSLALVKVAQGRADEARSLLVANASTVPAGDYGLAMALAGDPQEGVRILSEAIHDPAASVRTRQNLAYAYALAGRWKDARTMAGMDLAPLAANKRISDWAQIAQPSLAPQRVASLMGVAIAAEDPGQPVALALGNGTSSPVEMAQAEPAKADPFEAYAPPPVDVAMASPAVATPVADTSAVDTGRENAVIETNPAANMPAPARIAAPRRAAAAPARKAAVRPPVRVAAAPVARMQKVAFIKPAANASNWVVQLGAYDSAAIAKEKWATGFGRNDAIGTFPVQTSQTKVNGRIFYRLAISGFGDRADAAATCRAIRASHGRCFVRESAPGATPQRWAVADRGRQFASR